MSEPDASAVVELRDLYKVYSQGALQLPVLRGIEMCVRAGEVVALMGPSGSGKSTLLNILGCLDRPSSGHYLLGGRDVSTLGRAEQAWVRLHYIGFIFQAFHLLSDATVLENVAMPMFYAGLGRKERDRKAQGLLERVGLGDRLQHRPSELSGGQRQRVAIARAIANGPRLLLADEPTGALDTRTGDEVLKLLGDLHKETGLAILIVTHDAEVAEFAQRTVRVRDGLVV
ncbi:MAG TPA: ABC transporter ATP-binding protein, partial [Polyangiales bacterium]|nr:ABC transporter ATP-binding protein [Polyangiales bacterium]